MSELENFDLDVATSLAWDRFHGRLAVHLDEMDDDEILLIGTQDDDEESDEVSPYVQVTRDDGVFHFEVSSNRYLTDHHRLDTTAEAALKAFGLDDDEGTSNFAIDVEHHGSDPAELATIAVGALRDVFGVVHPAFLQSAELVDEELGDEPIAIVPQSREHLRSLVDQALVPLLGGRPDHDEDDDIPLVDDDGVCFIRVQRAVPIVEIFTTVVDELTNLEAARFEVNVLNRDSAFLRYVVVDDAVVAKLCLPAMPFAPQHLRDTLHLFKHHTTLAAPDLAHRVGGHRQLDGDDDDEE